MAAWTTRDIPSQAGKQAVITGATGGLGYETALELARAGAAVVLAGRSEAKGADALSRLRAAVPQAKARFEKVDLASLDSVAGFAGRLVAAGQPIDLLINNAGVMALPTRQTSADGFELQFATNYLSHFALTARVLPLLRQARMPRVVSLSSITHLRGAINFSDLQFARAYKPWAAYAQSKLAMLMFALELERRSAANNWGVLSNAAHPGWARTDLVANGPASNGGGGLLNGLQRLVTPVFSQDATAGALPTLYAATATQARGGAYYGPDGFAELKGAPTAARIARQASDAAAAARLWDVSVQLAGVSFAARQAAA